MADASVSFCHRRLSQCSQPSEQKHVLSTFRAMHRMVHLYTWRRKKHLGNASHDVILVEPKWFEKMATV